MRDVETNPFFVLGVAPTCTRVEMERQGQLLLSMLEVGFAEARTYETPLGERVRTPEAVREAMSTLRDPDRRLRAELWARAPVARPGEQETEAPASAEAPSPSAWPSAMRALGWKR